MYRALIAVALMLPLAVALAGDASALEGSRFREAVRSRGGVVASESPAASRAGLEVLDRGGNATDAAVAATFALGVARPESCGIGGGGFMVYRGADGEAATLDFRETAPAAIEPDTFAGQGLYKTFTGHTTVGVPGTVAGMQAALDRYGTVGLAETIAPAERLAREGFEVPESLSEEMGNNAARLKLFPAARKQFLVGGEESYPEGSTLVQPELADTLALIAEGGPDVFYRGEISDRIVADMQDADDPGDEGLMTKEDLTSYRAVWREPLVGEYRGREILGVPPPTSGGIAVIEMLNILEGYDLSGAEDRSSANALHLIAESQKLAFADRNEYVADPDFADVPTEQLIDKGYAETRREEIDPEKANSYEPGDPNQAQEERPAGSETNPSGSTTHLSVIDAAGNAVALTCTIEQSFGSAVVAPGTGFLLNNELTDFSEPGTANEPEPGKRPRSSISPTIVVEDGEPILAVGGAGGARIIMGSLFAVVNTVDYGLDPAEAIDAERLDEQSNPQMTLENGRISPITQAKLLARGHKFDSSKQRAGEYADLPRVQVAGVDPETGERLAATDPRSGEQASVGQNAVGGLPQTGGLPLAGCSGPPLQMGLCLVGNGLRATFR